ncbi:MAG: polymorphic toxin type 50 domain-containing protein [Chlamydiales bacterium]|nr:polymorphic toxin type 50 domain-containing protein [Chlamydiales bacterium]
MYWRIFFLCLYFLFPLDVYSLRAKLEYEGVSFTCRSGCGVPRYDGAAYDILYLFETTKYHLEDFYAHGLKTDAWYEKHKIRRLSEDDSLICCRQKALIEAFQTVEKGFSQNESEYNERLRKEVELHRENIEAIQRISETGRDVTYRNGRVIGPAYSIGEAYNAESWLQHEREQLTFSLKELGEENEFALWRAKLDKTYNKMDALLQEIFFWCLQHHQTEGISFRATIESLLQKDYLEAMQLLRHLLNILENKSFSANELGKIHLLRGQVESEYGQYAQAIESLTAAIAKNPSGQEAYLERAAAYFELGDFEQAIEDYLQSDFSSIETEQGGVEWEQITDIGLGIALGLVKGVGNGCIEYIPQILNSLHGLSRGLWAFCAHPVGASTAFVRASLDCIDYLREHSTQEMIDQMAPELKALLNRFDRLEAFEKGESIGEVIGKFGIDILLTKGTGKAYSSLKRANQYMTLEALASPSGKQTIVKEASEYLARREQVLKSANLKIQWDKQGKHLEGHRNYKPKDAKSILEHPDPQRLVKECAGKGRKVSPDSKLPGQSGYKEVVDFEEFIGYHVDETTKVKLPTTRGTIHYAQDGVHVVPARPEG